MIKIGSEEDLKQQLRDKDMDLHRLKQGYLEIEERHNTALQQLSRLRRERDARVFDKRAWAQSLGELQRQNDELRLQLMQR